MRAVGRTILGLAVAFLIVGLVGGQQPGGFGKGGFGGGGFQQDAVTLLRNESVKKELSITEDQTEQIPAAILKGLAGVLNEKQMKRLREIELQQRGTNGFNDPLVQKQLKVSSEQAASIKTILDDGRKETQEAAKEAKGGNFQGMQEKLTAIRKETAEKVQNVLTADQKKAYKEMLGEEFKLEQKGGFGGGNFKNKKKKTTD